MRPATTRRVARAALAPVLITVLALHAAVMTNRALPATAPGGRLDLVAQTFFVGDDPAVIDLRVSGASAQAELRVRIFGPRTTRSGIRATYTTVPGEVALSDFPCPLALADAEPDPEPDPEVQPVDRCPLSEIGSGGLYSITIPDDQIGELLRRDQGALPVVIDLTDRGVVVDTIVTSLLVLDDRALPRIGLALVADLTTPPALQPDQSLLIDGPALLERAEAVEALTNTPVTVALGAESLRALAETGDTATLDALTTVLADRSLLRVPWVELDEEAWRLAGEADLVLEHYALGITTVEEILGRSPSTIARLDTDATAETLGLLRSAGTTGVVVGPDQLTASTRDGTAHRPFRLLDDNGLPMAAVRIDDDLHDTLADTDAELGGHRALTELALAGWSARTDLAVVLDLDRLDPVALDVVLSGIAQRDFLRTVSVEQALALPPARTAAGDTLRGRLEPDPAPDLGSLAADIQVTRGLLRSYAAMVAPAVAPIVPLETQLLAAASAHLAPEESGEYTSRVFAAVLAGTDGLSVVRSDRVTLTDRRADLPLTLRNEQPLPITLNLELSAEKLRFPDGERQTVVLQPGDNPRTIRVETLASGDARVTATLTSPDGRLELGTGTVDIRSTAISGLGLLISAVALLVLGFWWARTIVRVRRDRAAATVAPAPDDGSGGPWGEP